jgi:DNA-binding LacI/PurR family transcriptional regulator
LWQGTQTTGVPSVRVDNDAGIRSILDHLIALGHQRIAFLGGSRLGDIKEREDTFVKHLSRLREPLREGYIQHGPNEPGTSVAALERVLALPEPPTAVVASTDVLAIGLLHAAYERGVRVPDQLSITGFDDIPVAEFTVPTLTTVRMPVRDIVEQAVRMALDDPEHAREAPPPVLQPALIVRASTGRVPGE